MTPQAAPDYELCGSPSYGLWMATLGFFVGFAAVSLFGPTAKEFQVLLGLNRTEQGLLIAAPALTGSLLRVPFAAWVDTSGGLKPFLVLLSLSVLGMLGLTGVIWSYYPDGMTRDLYPLLLVLGALSGCGIATFSVGVGQVSYWFPQARLGSTLGTYAGVGNLAPGLFAFLLPIVLASLGLLGTYVAWLILLIAGTVTYGFLGCNAWYFQLTAQGVPPDEAKVLAAAEGQELFPTGSLKASLLNSARAWQTWPLVSIYFTTFGGFIALTMWLPTYYQDFLGVSLKAAGGLTAIYAIVASLVRVPGGKLSDRVGGHTTLLLSLCVMIAGGVVLATSTSVDTSVIGQVLAALGMGVANAAAFKLVPEHIPHAVGGAAGWVGGLGALGGFALPPVLGSIVERWGREGFASGFWVFVVLAFVAAGLTLLLQFVGRRARD
jgi:NNP family nitrate/nitrite transporter-like MFS transporter